MLFLDRYFFVFTIPLINYIVNFINKISTIREVFTDSLQTSAKTYQFFTNDKIYSLRDQSDSIDKK